jgi:hypothetical protein
VRRALALALLALAGCGGDEDKPRLAAPAGSADAAELSCDNGDRVDLDSFAVSGDPVADTRALFEDELDGSDIVEKLGSRSARVIRAGQVVAVVRFRVDGIDGIDVCPSFSG